MSWFKRKPRRTHRNGDPCRCVFHVYTQESSNAPSGAGDLAWDNRRPRRDMTIRLVTPTLGRSDR